MSRIVFVVGFILVQSTDAVRGDDWPNFRGPGASAVSHESHAPVEWSATKNIGWKARIPGYGWSSPIVSGGKVFVVTAVAPNQKKPMGGSGMMLGFIPRAVFKWELHCLS